MRIRTSFLNSIFTQTALIIIGFALVPFFFNIDLFRESMREIAVKEVGNKAALFLSSMETPVRRLLNNKGDKTVVEIISEQAEYLEDHLKFAIVRVDVRNAEGTIIDHTRKEKIGETYKSDDFLTVVETRKPLIKETIKTLKLVPGQPEVPVIDATYPIISHQNGKLQAVIKITISLRKSFQLIQEDYQKFTRKVIMGISLATLFMVASTLFLLRRRIISPILSVSKGATKVAQGDLNIRLQASGSNEITALMNSFNKMVGGLKQREQMRQSLKIAQEVQQNLLPGNVPEIEGLEIAGKSLYCDETGGDYFDFIDLSKQGKTEVGLVIGDVSGHGISSALLMATARAFLRQRVALPGDLAQIVSDVNTQLSHDVADSGNFMTMFCMVVDNTNKSLNWVRAGHDPAILYDPETDSFSELKGAGVALGLDETWQYTENTKTDLKEGQLIVLATDGIWEARNEEGEMFGKEPIYSIIRSNASLSASSLMNKITEHLKTFQGNAMVEDDITLIIMKVTS